MGVASRPKRSPKRVFQFIYHFEKRHFYHSDLKTFIFYDGEQTHFNDFAQCTFQCIRDMLPYHRPEGTFVHIPVMPFKRGSFLLRTDLIKWKWMMELKARKESRSISRFLKQSRQFENNSNFFYNLLHSKTGFAHTLFKLCSLTSFHCQFNVRTKCRDRNVKKGDLLTFFFIFKTKVFKK